MTTIPKTCGHCYNIQWTHSGGFAFPSCGELKWYVDDEGVPPADCPLRQAETMPIERLRDEQVPVDADIARVAAENFHEMYEPLDQPDTVLVPPKSTREITARIVHAGRGTPPAPHESDLIQITLREYDRMRAFAKFGESVFWGFWNDGEPCDFDGWELQSEAAEADLIVFSDSGKILKPVYEPKGGE